jgi:excisionase family DNA binding protein
MKGWLILLNDYGDILKIDELCEVLLIGKNAAYKLLESGELKGFRFGRTWKISKVSVEDFILKRSGFRGRL